MKKTALLLFLVLLLIVNVAFAAPIVNEWLAPFDSTPVYLKGVQNVQVNVTDTANPINAVLLDINGTNLSMSQNGDIWSYPWNTDIYSEGVYNFNLFANNSIGENTTSTLSDIYVDRTIPAIFNAISGANPRDYVAAGAGFNALVDTTDLSPIKNVTCVLDGSIVEAVFVAGNQYSCALTAPTAENDYTITFNSEDTVGNINTTTADFTTRITTAAQISANAIVISDLNQSDKEGVLITARLTNNGNSPMHDSVVEIDPIESSIGTSTVYVKPCNKTKLDAGQYCDIIFNLTINGGVPPKDYIVFWTANWTDNNFDTQTRTPYDESIITVLSNPIVEVQDNLSLSVSHGTNATQQIGINSTGNDNLSNIGISYTQISLPSSWVNIQSSLNNIPGGSSGLFDLTIVVPEFAYPGTYAGRLTISATGATTEYIDLFVEVVEDNSWTVSPINIDAYVKSGTTGLVGTYSVNNSGNIDQNYNMSYNGTLYNYIMDDALTPTSLNVPRNSVRTFSIYIDKTVPYNSYLLNIDVAGKNSVHKFNTMNLYVDDNAPSITITNPANNAEVSGLVEINTTATDLMLQGIVFEINPVGLCNNGSTQSGITTGISLNDSYVWDPSGFCDAQYTIKATAYDKAGNQNENSINVTLNNANELPIVANPIADFSFDEDTIDTSINLSNVFYDIDNDPLTYDYVILNNNTNVSVVIAPDGVVTLTPDPDYYGVLDVSFTADDGFSNSSDNVLITILNVNDAPSIPNLHTPVNGSSVTHSQGASLGWNFSDDVDNNVLTYNIYHSDNPSSLSLLDSVAFARYDINGTQQADPSYLATGLTNGTAYYWQVSADDGVNESGNSTMFEYTYFIDNSPSIDSWFWQTATENSTTITTITIPENTSVYFEANISDPDGDLIDVSWKVNDVVNAIDSILGSGTVSWIYNSDFLSAGTHNISISIVDQNNNLDSMKWTVNVADLNRAPQIASQIPDQSIAEDSNATIILTNVSAYFIDLDPDNNLTYNVSAQNQSEVLCTLNGDNLSITPALDWFGVGADAASCSINAFDGIDYSADNTFSINVTNANDAPTIIVDDIINAEETVALFYDVNATDPDGDSDISTFWSDSSLFAVDPVNGTFSFTPAFEDIGLHNITFYVNDTAGATASKIVTLLVSFQNHAPVLNAIADQTVQEGSELIFSISAQDADLGLVGETLTFSSNISEMTFEHTPPTSAVVRWTPSSEYVGNNAVEFTVTDSAGASDSQIVNIEVINVNDAPQIMSYNPTFDPKIPEDGSHAFSITHWDMDGDPVTVNWYVNGSLAGSGDSFTFNANDTAGIHTYDISVAVSDGSLSDSRSWLVTTSDVPLSNNYQGSIMQLTPAELPVAVNVTIGNQYGKIDFGGSVVDLSDVVDLDRYVNIDLGIIAVDTNRFPSLKEPASLSLYSLTQSETPVIYYNEGYGVSGNNVCPATKCINVNYNAGTLTFDIDHFTTFWVASATTNYAPIITSSPVIGAVVNTAYSYQVYAHDPDSDPLTYSLTTAPAGMTISAAGLISWLPTIIGNYPVVVDVSDGSLSTTQSFTVYVSETGFTPGTSMLEITDFDVEVDGEDDKNLEDGDKIGEDARPGSEIDFSMEIRNAFDDNTEIEDIRVTVEIKDIDDGDDIEEESNEFDLDDGEDDEVELSLKIPLIVDDTTYDVVITVEGEDEDGNEHETVWTLYLDVEKEKHDLVIYNAEIVPSTVKCNSYATLDLEVVNIGRDDEEDIVIEIKSDELGIDIREEDIELDSGTDEDDCAYERTMQLSIDAVELGTYPVDITVYRDNDDQMDSERVDMVVEECEAAEPIDVQIDPATGLPYGFIPTPIIDVEESVEITFWQTDEYFVLLAIGFILLLGAVIYGIGAVVILSKKGKQF